jgi:hypothetical protein
LTYLEVEELEVEEGGRVRVLELGPAQRVRAPRRHAAEVERAALARAAASVLVEDLAEQRVVDVARRVVEVEACGGERWHLFFTGCRL